MPGPSNLYGVAAPVHYPLLPGNFLTGACPAGVETNVQNCNPLVAPSPGFWFPVFMGWLPLALGPTPPSAIIIGTRIGSGSDVTQTAVYANLLVANASIWAPYIMIGPPSNTLFTGAGTSYFLTVNPTGQAISVSTSGMDMIAWLFRAPDQ